MSVVTAYVPIPSGSGATTGLFNGRYQAIYDILNALNVPSLDSSAVGWNRGSITTTLNSSGGTLSVLSIGAASGNTITLLAALSVSTIQPQSGNTVSHTTYGISGGAAALSSLTVTNTAQIGSSVNIGGALSADTLGAFSTNTLQVPSHISLANKVLTGLLPPSAGSDAVNKAYADGPIGSFRPTWSVFSTSVTLSAGSFGYITSSGVSMLDSTNSLKCPAGNVVVCLTATSNSNVTVGFPGCEVGLYGTTLTAGTVYYANSSGGPTATAPSAQSTIVYAMGTAKSAQTLIFAPVYIGSNAT